jgi:kinesin family protein 5
LAKLDTIDTDTAISALTVEDVTTLRRQLVDGQQQVRDLMDKLIVTQETSEHHERRKTEFEQRLSALETEYEELLGVDIQFRSKIQLHAIYSEKTIHDEENGDADVAETMVDYKVRRFLYNHGYA